ncbi:plant cysteine oxidase 3-like [Humulus lupulus]|uniref:plant cysteine oxidase 3-like n=1 Tax=Humulus lupulus TaxID=3486 RepID=UPI002B405976|nr:plant cysteine oxidase 3-like [Humulus lupulus]
MFSKFQKATDKLRTFVQKRTNNCRAFGRPLSMMKKSSSNPKIQTLYDLCKKTFTPSGSPPPSSEAIQRICSVLDTMSPADVGLKEENPDEDRGHGFFGIDQLNRVARWAQPITYLDVYEADSFTMCIFCFPTSSVIPLHDHPGMNVFSKILYGSLHVKAYDWVEPAIIKESKGSVYFPVRLAKLVVDQVITAPCETSVLYPKSGGNLHCFTAVTPCAVLDVLAPPYRENAGRRCTYYHDYPYVAFSNLVEIGDEKEENYAWLAQIETPDDLYMRQGKYVGPTIRI